MCLRIRCVFLRVSMWSEMHDCIKQMNIPLAVFFFFLPLVRYINRIHIISEKITDSSCKQFVLNVLGSRRKKKKKKILSCQEYVSNLSVFWFIPFIADCPRETTTSQHSLHSLQQRGKQRRAGQVSKRNGGSWTARSGEVGQYIRRHVEGVGRCF